MRALPPLLFALLLAACGDENNDPAGADQLHVAITANGGYRGAKWQRAPDYPVRRASFTAHGSAVEIFVNEPVARALLGTTPIAAWPDGSILVKESYQNDSLWRLAAMEKRGQRWFWAEYDSGGEAVYSGEPSECVDCHKTRSAYADWVYALEFPR